MLCPESLRVQAYVDGEADALTGAQIERHLEHCSECQQQQRDIEALRTALRRDVPLMTAPAALRREISRRLDAEPVAIESAQALLRRARHRPHSFWMGAAGGFATAAALTVIAIFVLEPPDRSRAVDDVLGAHVNALMSSHLIDVISTDQHTVKPWFAGRAEVSPVVADFAAQGYPLQGGRVDYLRHQRAAVLVYAHGRHIIDVFCWAAAAEMPPGNATRNGYHLLFWKSGDLAYAAVSDTGWAELSRLEQLLRGLEAGAPPTQ